MSASRRVELSVGLRNFSRDDRGPEVAAGLVEGVEALDALDVDRVVLSDHVVFGPDLSAYGDPSAGGLAGGVQPTGPDGVWLEPLTVAAFLAARTGRIRFATGIVLAALRRPVVLAKVAATLDVLSGGRLDLGVGVGWQRAEYQAAGLDFEERGRLLDDTLHTCQRLWTGRPVELDGTDGPVVVQSCPVPVSGTVPVWVSGSLSGPVVRRTARFGVGWIPWGAALAEPVRGLAEFREALARQLEDLARDDVPTPLRDVTDLRAAAAVRVPAPDSPGRLRAVVRAALAPVPELVRAGYDDLRLSVVPSDVPLAETVAEVLAQLDGVLGR